MVFVGRVRFFTLRRLRMKHATLEAAIVDYAQSLSDYFAKFRKKADNLAEIVFPAHERIMAKCVEVRRIGT